MLEADEEYFKAHQEPLFSSHMLDLSEESKDENIATCVKYFTRMAKIGLWLEMEIGITGGEEDGVDNTGVDNASLYTQPEDIYDVYSALSAVSPNFSIAAAFGNVHGVYKPGNVRLQPELLAKHQAFTSQKLEGKVEKPLLVSIDIFSNEAGLTLIQVPCIPRRIWLRKTRDQDRCREWRCQDERRHWYIHFPCQDHIRLTCYPPRHPMGLPRRYQGSCAFLCS